MVHHSGWNSCSSCHGDPSAARRYLILPSLLPLICDRYCNCPKNFIFTLRQLSLYIFWTRQDWHILTLLICLASGDILVFFLGDKDGNAKGNGFLLDSDFKVKGRHRWEKPGYSPSFGYDFSYQPRHKTMISSSWGAPAAFTKGFNLQHVSDGLYGRHLSVYSWPDSELKQTVDLGNTGLVPLEIRFLHDPSKNTGFVGCALTTNMVRFFMTSDATWNHEVAISVEPLKV